MTDAESRLVRLETKILDLEEKHMILWTAHDMNAKEYRAEVREMIQNFRSEMKELLVELIKKTTNLPCSSHLVKFENYDKNIALLWKVVIGVIFGGIVLGLWTHGVGI